MNLVGSKLLVLGIASALITAPLILWIALYVATTKCLVDLRPLLPWLKRFQWIGLICAGGLLVCSVANSNFPVIFGNAMTCFAVGIGFPERWLKRQYALPNPTA